MFGGHVQKTITPTIRIQIIGFLYFVIDLRDYEFKQIST
jgi:hypothetical protein